MTTDRAVVQGSRRVLALLASAVLFGACAGENAFTLPANAGGSGPQVDITSPTSGQEVAVGEALAVSASVAAQQGAAVADFTGVYEADGTSAYAAESQSLNGLVNLTLNQTLTAAAGQDAGTAIVIVEVTDQLGEIGADSVTVTITN